MGDDFSTKQVFTALKLNRERFRVWVDKGFIEPTYRGKGTGDGHRFDRLDVYGVGLFHQLVEKFGFPCQEASQLVKRWLTDLRDVGKVEEVMDRSKSKPEGLLVFWWTRGEPQAKGPISYKAFAQLVKQVFDGGEWEAVFTVNLEQLVGQVDAALA